MFLKKLKLGKYRVSGKPAIKIIDRTPMVGEYEERVEIPSSTIMTVLRVNNASLRVHLKFKDADKADRTVRIAFEDNPGDYKLTEL